MKKKKYNIPSLTLTCQARRIEGQEKLNNLWKGFLEDWRKIPNRLAEAIKENHEKDIRAKG